MRRNRFVPWWLIILFWIAALGFTDPDQGWPMYAFLGLLTIMKLVGAWKKE